MKGRWNPEIDPLADLQGGRTETFEAFVRDETPALRAFFRRLGARPAEADDLVQETFLKLYSHAASYTPQGRFRPFAFRIARNAWIDRQRKRARRPLEHGDSELDADGEKMRPTEALAAEIGEPHTQVSRDEEVARLRSALAELSEPHRVVFELGVVQELPYAEIAEALDIPVGTVKSRMFHAVRKLRAVLETQPETGLEPEQDGKSRRGGGAR